MPYFQKGFIITLAKVNKLLQRACAAAVSEYRFTPNEVEVLLFLMNNPAHDTATEIAQYRNVSKALVAKSVESLCRRGFLTAERDTRDRRVVHLHLSGQSSGIARRLLACEDALFARIEQGIPPACLDAAGQAFPILRENIDSLLKEFEER